MKSGRFVLYEPTSVDQAVLMLSDVADQDGRILAGGQTLIPAMALRLAQPSYLIDINRINGISDVSETENGLVINAGVRHAAFHNPGGSRPLAGLLKDVVRHIAHLPIRHRGTFCGSIANADPASEWCLVAATLDAAMIARSVRDQREIPVGEYFQGYMQTALRPDEMLVAVRLPILPENACFGFDECSRRAGDFAQAMALCVFQSASDYVNGVRIGVGAIEPTPRRMAAAEAVLEGQQATLELFHLAAETAARNSNPVASPDSDATYKRSLVKAVVFRSLVKAMGRNWLGAQKGCSDLSVQLWGA